MAKGMYFGANSVARKCKKAYIGVGGAARKIKKIYVGVGGVARLAWSGGKIIESYVHKMNGTWAYARLTSGGTYEEYVTADSDYAETYSKEETIQAIDSSLYLLFQNASGVAVILKKEVGSNTWTTINTNFTNGVSFRYIMTYNSAEDKFTITQYTQANYLTDSSSSTTYNVNYKTVARSELASTAFNGGWNTFISSWSKSSGYSYSLFGITVANNVAYLGMSWSSGSYNYYRSVMKNSGVASTSEATIISDTNPADMRGFVYFNGYYFGCSVIGTDAYCQPYRFTISSRTTTSPNQVVSNPSSMQTSNSGAKSARFFIDGDYIWFISVVINYSDTDTAFKIYKSQDGVTFTLVATQTLTVASAGTAPNFIFTGYDSDYIYYSVPRIYNSANTSARESGIVLLDRKNNYTPIKTMYPTTYNVFRYSALEK